MPNLIDGLITDISRNSNSLNLNITKTASSGTSHSVMSSLPTWSIDYDPSNKNINGTKNDTNVYVISCEVYYSSALYAGNIYSCGSAFIFITSNGERHSDGRYYSSAIQISTRNYSYGSSYYKLLCGEGIDSVLSLSHN